MYFEKVLDGPVELNDLRSYYNGNYVQKVG